MPQPKWKMIHPQATIEHLGYLPGFLNVDDPRSAIEQLDANYIHGGGWRKFDRFKVNMDRLTIQYPGDPAHPALAETTINGDRVIVFDGAWVMVVRPDGTHEIARMD